jgi:hypothetical protein
MTKDQNAFKIRSQVFKGGDSVLVTTFENGDKVEFKPFSAETGEHLIKQAEQRLIALREWQR